MPGVSQVSVLKFIESIWNENKCKPNLCNPILAFSRIFETLEGYFVFRRGLAAAAHTHTYYKLLHIAVVTRRSWERFLPTVPPPKNLLITYNPEYLILKGLFGPPQCQTHSGYFQVKTIWRCLTHTGEAILKSYFTLLAWLGRV